MAAYASALCVSRTSATVELNGQSTRVVASTGKNFDYLRNLRVKKWNKDVTLFSYFLLHFVYGNGEVQIFINHEWAEREW